MDLKIRDVAEMLNVHPTTIRRWLKAGKIPAYRINSQFRFNRNEIENWVIASTHAQQEEVPPEEQAYKKGGTRQYSLYRAINNGVVFLDVIGEEKEQVIRNAVGVISEKLGIESEFLTELLLERERLHPTALSKGVAVPHTRDFLLSSHQDFVGVVYLKEPIAFGSLDGKPVHTLFFLFACDDKRHLHLLAKIAHFCNDPQTETWLLKRPPKQELMKCVKAWEGGVSSEVCK